MTRRLLCDRRLANLGWRRFLFGFQMDNHPPCHRIHEAMRIDGTSASISICQDSQALEAEPDATMTAQHLVALLALVGLVGKILLRHAHLALRALFCTSFAHPPTQTLLSASVVISSGPQSMHLTRQAFVEWLRPTPQARAFPALWTRAQPSLLTFL